MHPVTRHALAIIGIGPKGFFCLERLIAHLGQSELSHPVDIYLLHRDGVFGSSPVYSLEQPEYIILNVAVGEVDLWSSSDPPPYSGRGPNFIEWYATRYPDRPILDGSEFLSRAIVGHYLKENFHRLEANLPPQIRLIKYRGEAVDLEPEANQIRVHWCDQTSQLQSFLAQQVLLATGHSRLQPTSEEEQWATFANGQPKAQFIPFVYPVKERLKDINPGQTVAIKGLGLTCIDAVLELTQGRGGIFHRDVMGQLNYQPSGREPHIFPFSRTGLPMAPKAVDLPTFLRPLHFCTPEALTRLREVHGGQVSLEQGPWALFELEMKFYYYEWAMSGTFAKRLAHLEADETAFKALIQEFHAAHPEIPAFNPEPVLDPVKAKHLQSGETFHQLIDETMSCEINRAKRGFAGDGLKSAIDIWYEVRYAISRTMAFSGLTPQSHRKLMEEINPVFKRVVFGPPLINLEKMYALLRANILNFTVARAPKISTHEELGKFRLDSETQATIMTDILIDGRYPQIKLDHDATPLYQNLRRRGLGRAFENKDALGSGNSYSPGSIDHSEEFHYLIDTGGKQQPHLSVIGIPTEGNLLGNFTIVSDGFPNTWASQATGQILRRESELVAP